MQNDDLMIDDGTHFDDDKLLLAIMMMSSEKYYRHGKYSRFKKGDDQPLFSNSLS